MRKLYTLFLLLEIALAGWTQNQKYIHQTFSMDTAKVLQLDLFGEFSIEPWLGDAVMVETRISLYDASESILKHFIEQGRYAVEATRNGASLMLKSKDKERKPIGTPRGVSREEVAVRVFIPEQLQPLGPNQWTLPKDEAPEENLPKGSGGD